MRIELVPIKYPYTPARRWEFWQWTDIPSSTYPGYVYLRRLRVVSTPLFGLYLHFIIQPDLVPDPHDHPWEFWTIVLRGEYEELVYRAVHVSRAFSPVRHRWPRFSWHHFDLSWAHKIVAVAPGTVTLVWTGRKSRDWGFYTVNGFVPRKEYLAVQEALRQNSTIDPFDC